MHGEVWVCGSKTAPCGWTEGQPPQLCPAAGKSTICVLTFAKYEWFEEWKDEQVNKRGDDYEDLKKAFVDVIMQVVFKLYPRIEDRVRKPGVHRASSSSLGPRLPSPIPSPLPPDHTWCKGVPMVLQDHPGTKLGQSHQAKVFKQTWPSLYPRNTAFWSMRHPTPSCLTVLSPCHPPRLSTSPEGHPSPTSTTLPAPRGSSTEWTTTSPACRLRPSPP